MQNYFKDFDPEIAEQADKTKLKDMGSEFMPYFKKMMEDAKKSARNLAEVHKVEAEMKRT